MKIFFLCLLFINPALLWAEGDIIIGKTSGLTSKILQEERPYRVSLPDGYEKSDQKYPVLYLLDGEGTFHTTSGVIKKMSHEDFGLRQVPEMIIIAIPNTNRVRDFTPSHDNRNSAGVEMGGHEQSGGADNFLRFIEQELIPHVEKKYRATDQRILIGHSYGGLFSLHVFLKRPGLFQRIIAIDPSLYWDDKMMIGRAKKLITAAGKTPTRLFISLADHPRIESFRAMTEGVREFAEILSTVPNPNLHVKLGFFEKENHATVVLPSLYKGLHHLFPEFRATYNAAFAKK